MNQRLICAAIAAGFCVSTAFAADSGEKSAAGGSSSSGSTQKTSGAEVSPLAVVLVPVLIAQKQDLGECWAKLYTDPNFHGDQLSLVGPVDMPNMRTPFGRDWSGEFESIAVGPKATVTIYDNENYTQKAATFKAGQRVPKLDKKLGFFEQVHSVKIACAGGQRNAEAKSGSAAGSSSASKEDSSTNK
jgi:hypothetical protein